MFTNTNTTSLTAAYRAHGLTAAERIAGRRLTDGEVDRLEDDLAEEWMAGARDDGGWIGSVPAARDWRAYGMLATEAA
jgi:hypothetical protein